MKWMIGFAAALLSLTGWRLLDGRRPPAALAVDESGAARLRTHVHELATVIGERHPGRPRALQAAAAYIQRQFREAGYAAEQVPFAAQGQVQFNIVAERPGRGAPLIIGAHYDSVPGSPGADDNASGVAVLLELARQLHGAEGRPITFVAFANEEAPRADDMGSYHFIRYLGERAARLDGMICLEMVGYYRSEAGTQSYPVLLQPFYPSRGNFVALVANWRSRHLLSRLLAPLRKARGLPFHAAMLPSFIGGIDRSDHVHFWRAGVPAVMVSDTAFYRNRAYHQSTDTEERLDYRRMAVLAGNLETALRAD